MTFSRKVNEFWRIYVHVEKATRDKLEISNSNPLNHFNLVFAMVFAAVLSSLPINLTQFILQSSQKVLFVEGSLRLVCLFWIIFYGIYCLLSLKRISVVEKILWKFIRQILLSEEAIPLPRTLSSRRNKM